MLELENFTTWTEADFETTTLGEDFSLHSNSSLFNFTNVTQYPIDADNDTKPELNIPYTVMESIVATVAVIGNALVIIVFYRERRLRRRTNYYIISLALADFLVGLLGIPFAILVSKLSYLCVHEESSTFRFVFTVCNIASFVNVSLSLAHKCLVASEILKNRLKSSNISSNFK